MSAYNYRLIMAHCKYALQCTFNTLYKCILNMSIMLYNEPRVTSIHSFK